MRRRTQILRNTQVWTQPECTKHEPCAFFAFKKTIALRVLQHRAMFCIALLALPSKGSSMHVGLPLNSAAPCRLDANGSMARGQLEDEFHVGNALFF